MTVSNKDINKVEEQIGDFHWRKEARKVYKRFYKEELVLCQLYRGQGKFPKTELMTSEVMSLKNRKLTKTYIAALDRNETTPLWEWRLNNLTQTNHERSLYVVNAKRKFLNIPEEVIVPNSEEALL